MKVRRDKNGNRLLEGNEHGTCLVLVQVIEYDLQTGAGVRLVAERSVENRKEEHRAWSELAGIGAMNNTAMTECHVRRLALPKSADAATDYYRRAGVTFETNSPEGQRN